MQIAKKKKAKRAKTRKIVATIEKTWDVRFEIDRSIKFSRPRRVPEE